MGKYSQNIRLTIILGSLLGYMGIVFSSPLAWIGADAIVIPVYAVMIRWIRKRMG